MKRRTLLTGIAATLAATPLIRSHAQQKATIRWWYHFDDPKATPDELVAAFEKANPGIKIQAENIFAPSTFERIGLLSEKLSAVQGIRKAISLPLIKKDLDPAGKRDLFLSILWLSAVSAFIIAKNYLRKTGPLLMPV